MQSLPKERKHTLWVKSPPDYPTLSSLNMPIHTCPFQSLLWSRVQAAFQFLARQQHRGKKEPVLFNGSMQRHCPLFPNGETEAGSRDVLSLSPAVVLGLMLPA